MRRVCQTFVTATLRRPAASISGKVQRRDLPRTVSVHASKLARGLSVPPGPCVIFSWGLPAQFTTWTSSALKPDDHPGLGRRQGHREDASGQALFGRRKLVVSD